MFTNEDNPSCPSVHFHSGRCIYYQSRPSLSGSALFIFTDTDFIECEVYGDDSYGGAIDCTAGDLIIKRCSFMQCFCSNRGGAVSFRSSGLCTQEDNIYSSCSTDGWSASFDSWDIQKGPSHNHRRCKYLNSYTQADYGHTCIEYSVGINIDSNIYIHGRTGGNTYPGTVVHHHTKKPLLFSNCLFTDGQAQQSGGLSLLAGDNTNSAMLTVKFCFFFNNYGKDNTAREIYFDSTTTINAQKELIIHSFSATPNSKVFIQNETPQDKDWLYHANKNSTIKITYSGYTLTIAYLHI